MTDLRQMLEDTVDKLFRDLMASGMPELGSESLPPEMWEQVEEMGISNLFLHESAGGFSGCWEDAYVVINLAGYYALPLPISETMLSHKLFLGIETPLPEGPISIAEKVQATLCKSQSGKFQFTGEVFNVPWGAAVGHIVAICEHDKKSYLILLARSDASEVRTGFNIAREPRDYLSFNDVPVVISTVNNSNHDLLNYGALVRTSQIAGALNSALRRSVEYANERSQFGRPIARFQAIQHQLAILASEVAAVSCAAMAACRAADVGDAEFEIAAAKLRANRAVGVATSIAHQVHGAIGFTKEHHLHYATQRLMSWRSEFGNDRYWSACIGKKIAGNGGNRFWSDITARSDRSA